MRVLIGFEESDTVRSRFEAAGHDAYSCDLKPSRNLLNKKHFQCDILIAIGAMKYDLIILHPVCRYMALCGNKHYGIGKPKHYLRLESIEFTQRVWEAALKYCDHVCLENPASVIFKHLEGDVQYIQPWMFGHMEQKKTGLILHGLPRLKETNNVYDAMMLLQKSVRERVFYMSPGENRERDRSKTFNGVGDAMVDQWGNIL